MQTVISPTEDAPLFPAPPAGADSGAFSARSGLRWLFLNLNSYFASIEQQERPELRGRPVAVVPMETDYTCAIAASYEAKAYGVRTGTRIKEAKQMCPGLQCVLARHNVYVDYHERILDEVEQHLHISKIWSIDEVACELLGREREPDNARALALRIKQGIRRNVGSQISCSIGLGSNSLLAKIGSDMQKPDGLVLLDGDFRQRLFKLRLTDLPGINVNMERRLLAAGIRNVEQFWNLSPKHARKIWGSVQGERFWYWLHGYDFGMEETRRSTIGHSRVLDPEMRAPAPARQMARRLTLKAASRLRREDFYATAFYLSVRVPDGPRWAGELRLSPSQDNFALIGAMETLWGEMLADLGPPRLKKISVTLTGLCRRQDITPDLFDTTSEASRRLRASQATLSRSIDALNKKYGAETVQFGISPRTKAGYVGTKIAFSRVPDKAEFRE